MELGKVIGDNIKAYREKFGYSQENLANCLGVDRSIISHYENGNREISIIHLNKLADLFANEVEDLIEENSIERNANIAFAFRREGMDNQDLNSIASFQKVVKNYLKITKLLKSE
jgi:transcriptional regulator with XRE-family HTH domain